MLLASPLLGLAACGDDDDTTSSSSGGTTSSGGTEAGAQDGARPDGSSTSSSSSSSSGAPADAGPDVRDARTDTGTPDTGTPDTGTPDTGVDAGTVTVGGSVTGLTGTGLILRNNGANNLAITANGAFTFTTGIPRNQTYNVTVFAQPGNPAQTCTVTNGTGTATANVTNVAVTCAAGSFSVGGNVTGLTGTVVLSNNGADDVTVSADGAYTFGAQVASGAPYAVTVKTQPVGQVCTVTNGTGTMGSASISNADVACVTQEYSVGGNVIGLGAGKTLTLQNNGVDDLPVTVDGAFTFPTKILSGGGYNVTILTQPADQTCSLASAAGTVEGGDVTSVVINCSVNTYTVGGNVSGLVGTLTLANGADSVTVSADGSFTFPTPLQNGATYTATISAQPVGQTCAFTPGTDTGTVAAAPVTSIAVTCTTNMHNLGVTVTGLNGTLVLTNNGGDNLTITADGTVNFPTQVAYGTNYLVEVLSEPAAQSCLVTGGSGSMPDADVTSISVVCAAGVKIGGTVQFTPPPNPQDPAPNLVIQNNGGDNVVLTKNGKYVFPHLVQSNTSYAVTVLTQPVGYTCTVANASGPVTTQDVVNVNITCTATPAP